MTNLQCAQLSTASKNASRILIIWENKLNLSRDEYNRLNENKQYLPAMSLLHLADTGGLHDSAGNLKFYHRRFKSNNINDLVCRTDQ